MTVEVTTPMTAEQLEAVLFDMDGLLVDTEPSWFLAESETVASLGGTWTHEHQQALLGTNLEYSSEYMRALTGSAVPVGEIRRRLLDAMTRQLERGLSPRKGVLDLIEEIRAAGIPAGIVTSSVREHVELVLASLEELAPGMSSVFGIIVTADDVVERKPAPEPYLAALAALRVRAERTVVLEDSPAGTAAGEAAGCWVIAVPSEVEMSPGPRRRVVSHLGEVSLADLRTLVSGGVPLPDGVTGS
jgi:HAD superfamily hydrolase (TIGR01509 family)